MNEKPKRPWFQLHLSTLLVLAISAGLLGWIWFVPYELVTKAAYYDHRWFLYVMVALLTVCYLTTIGCILEKWIRSREDDWENRAQ